MTPFVESAAFALRYATQEPRPSQESFLEAEADDAPVPFDYFFWLLRPSDPIVIDCGFDQRTRTSPGRKLLSHPAALLQRLGIAPSDVKTVVLTHLHYDHAGCLDLFPSATFYVQAAEVAYCTSPAMGYPSLRRHYRVEHLQSFLTASFEGRVRQIDGSFLLQQNFELHRVPGHTPGQQIVRANLGEKSIVLASDALHLMINLHRRNPFPIVTDVPDSYAAFDKLIGLAGDESRIIPGHDPGIAERFHTYQDDSDIIRLDAPK